MHAHNGNEHIVHLTVTIVCGCAYGGRADKFVNSSVVQTRKLAKDWLTFAPSSGVGLLWAMTSTYAQPSTHEQQT
jgi:hypothetical protein